MKDGRFSTIRFNEWICISAQYEKAVARIGRQVYQGYSKGLVTDYTSIEICREISETFSEARKVREEAEEELERDALDGLNVEEAEKANEVLQLSQAQRTKRNVKLHFTKFLGKASINRNLAAHRDRVKELSRDLGLRALICVKEEPVLKVRGHKNLCRLANRLQDDADAKWEEIAAGKEKGGGGLSFHTILFGFVGDFAKFSKNTYVGRTLLKFFKYNEKAENEKLTKQYAGTQTEQALRAQMEEIDEPMLDVGREIDNMQQEYEDDPEEWSIVPTAGTSASFSPDTDGTATPQATTFDFSPDADNEWVPDADAWNPDDSSADDDFLDAVSDAPDFAPQPEPTPPPAQPTLLRKRSEPEAESWNDEPAPPPAPSLPQAGQSKPPAAKGEDDWGWGTEPEADNNSSWDSKPILGNSGFPTPAIDPSSATMSFDAVPFAEALGQAGASPQEGHAPPAAPPAGAETDFMSRPSGKKPPFVKAQESQQDWLGATPEPASPPKPADPAGDYGWGTPATPEPPKQQAEPDYGWGTPASEVKDEAPKPTYDMPEHDPTLDTMQIDFNVVKNLMAEAGIPEDTPPPATASEEPQADPLLRLLRTDDSADSSASDSGELGDNLLPDFLRDRSDDQSSSADESFIPELPTFVESDSPNLEILPFGAAQKRQNDDDDGDEEPYIPQMPD